MSRLDDLYALRKQIDAEIEREHAAVVRASKIRRTAINVLSRGSWNTRVFAAACEHYAVSGDDVLGTNRSRVVLDARHVAMWLMRDAGRTLVEIGEEMGKDHTSVMNGVRRVESTPGLLAVAVELRGLLTGEAAA